MKPSEGNPVRERYEHLIAGEWVKPNGGAYFEGINPSTGEKLGSFARGDAADVDRAVRAAETGFTKWWDLDPHKRGQIMNKAAQLLRQHKERIAYLESLDMGKPLAITAGDVETSARYFEFYGGLCDKITGDTLPAPG